MTAQERLEAARKAEAEARSKFREALKERDAAQAAFNAAGVVHSIAEREWVLAGVRLSQAREAAASAEAEHEKAHCARGAAQRAAALGKDEVLP